MKKETGNWNDSAVNRPEASGSAGASTAGVDSLRSPGSFSSNSSDADQVGAQHFLHLLFSSFLFFFFGVERLKSQTKKGSRILSPKESEKTRRTSFFATIFGVKMFWEKKSKRERDLGKPEVDLRLGLFLFIIFPFFFIIIVCV